MDGYTVSRYRGATYNIKLKILIMFLRVLKITVDGKVIDGNIPNFGSGVHDVIAVMG